MSTSGVWTQTDTIDDGIVKGHACSMSHARLVIRVRQGMLLHVCMHALPQTVGAEEPLAFLENRAVMQMRHGPDSDQQ